MYKDFFGFKKSPFDITSDPQFLYMSRSHREALNHMLYGIGQKKGFISITGEVGTGKTTLCRMLFRQLDKKTKFAFIFNPGLNEQELLIAIAEDFGIKVKNPTKLSIFRALNAFLIKQLKRGYNVVLVIDEAQNMTVDVLEQIRMLSNLETENEKLFEIILVGQPELEQKLKLPQLRQLRQRISVSYNIKPLMSSEIGPYVYHRLNVAGSKGDIFFTADAIENVYEYSKGTPRLINLVCDKSMLKAYIMETKTITKDMVRESISDLDPDSPCLSKKVEFV